MPLQFTEPTHEDLFNWGGDNPLAYVAHMGDMPYAMGTEPIETELGLTWHTYKEYADVTVYIDSKGCIVVEFYQQEVPNPWNDRTWVYWLQCMSVLHARAQARIALEDTDGLLTADYFAALGYTKEDV